MRRIGHSLLGTASVIVLLSGTLMLVPNEASAQINIEGLIRGAIGHGVYGGSRHRASRHSSDHVSSRRKHDDSDSGSSADKGKDKDKDALDEDASNHDAKGGDTKLSHGLPSAPSRDAAQASDASAAKPSRASDDEPSFAPSR